jgi:hypothetical protein
MVNLFEIVLDWSEEFVELELRQITQLEHVCKFWIYCSADNSVTDTAGGSF